MYRVDLNSDLGESFGRYTLGMDERVIPLITSANIACGYHASDPVVMAKTVSLAKEAGIRVGAHPGFPDLMGFGRRNMAVTSQEARAYVLYQLGALEGFCRSAGLKLQHVKPHGALYNMAAKDYELARGICQAIAEFDKELIVLALSGGQLAHAAQEMGLRTGAMITDEEEAIARVIRMIKDQTVRAITGKDIAIRADSICVHGDGEKALAFVERIRQAFGEAGISLCPLEKLC